jgi:hypothetical protein
MRNFVVGLLLTLVLCGCSTVESTTAAEPQSGERARLRVISNYAVLAFPEKACFNANVPGAGVVFCSGLCNAGFKGRSLGMPVGTTPVDKGDAAEFYVRAGKPLTLGISYMTRRRDCAIAGWFVPEANQDYEAVGKVDGSTCSIRVWKIGNPNANVPLRKASGECW